MANDDLSGTFARLQMTAQQEAAQRQAQLAEAARIANVTTATRNMLEIAKLAKELGLEDVAEVQFWLVRRRCAQDRETKAKEEAAEAMGRLPGPRLVEH